MDISRIVLDVEKRQQVNQDATKRLVKYMETVKEYKRKEGKQV